MKKLFLAFAACLMAFSISAAELNIYASGLKAGTLSAEKTLTIKYVLNAPATSLEFQVLNASGIAVKTIALTDAALLTKGAHTGVEIDLSDCPAGEFTWALKASAAATEALSADLLADNASYVFSQPRGLAADVNPESPYFGQLYMGNSKPSTATPTGLVIFDALLAQQGDIYDGGVKWEADGWGPGRVKVGEDGYVYTNDHAGSTAGVWYMDPANPSVNFVEVLDMDQRGTTYSRPVDIVIEKSGADRVLYTMDYSAVGSATIRKYTIGANDKYAGAAEIIANVSFAAGQNSSLESDGRGGWWIAQHRASNDGYFALAHVDNNGNVDFKSNDKANQNLFQSTTGFFSYGGAMSLNKDKSLLAFGNDITVAVYAVAYGEDGKPALTELYRTGKIGTERITALCFDYANNLYVGSQNSKRLHAYATPSDNVCATPAAAKYSFEIEAEAGVVLAERITINEGAAATLEKGATKQLTTAVSPAETTNKTVLWSSDDEKVATIENGLVKAVGPGEATITAAIDAVATTFKVTVKKPVVTITGDAEITLERGKTQQLEATLTPIDAAATIVWSSNKTNVAIVSATGLVTAKGAGTATITAKTADSEEASVTINVTADPLAAGIYTIGGEDANYASLYDACADVNACGIAGDITLAIAADLTEPTNSGLMNTTEHTITIAPASAEKRTIKFTRPGDDNSGPSGSLILGINTGLAWADITPSQNFVIDGSFGGSEDSYLEINLNSGGGQLCVLGDVKNVEIKNISIVNTRTSSTAYAINIRERNNLAPSNVLIENCYLETKTSGGTCTALNFQLSTTGGSVYSKDVTVRNCELIATNRGIFMQAIENLTIEGCTFRILGKASVLGDGIYGYACRGSHIVRGNKFLECTTLNTAADNGFRGIVASGGGTWLIENNYFAGLDILAESTGKEISAQYVRTGNACVVRHNTFYVPALSKTVGTTLASSTPIACLHLAAGGQTVENNLFVSAEGTNNNSLIVGAIGTSTVKNNVFYHAGGNAHIATVTAKDVEPVLYKDWAAYSAEGTGLLATQPAAWTEVEFTDAAAGDLSLAAASDGNSKLAVPAIAEVTKDINGTARHEGKVYAGAYEGSNFKADDETAIENTKFEQNNVRKVIENGQMIIIRDGIRYNVMGVRMN